MIQPNKINLLIAPRASGKTYKSIQYCIEQQQQQNKKFILTTQYEFNVANMRQYIHSIFDNADCTITDAVSVLVGDVNAFNTNIIFDDVNKNIINLIALNNIFEKHGLDTVIITVSPTLKDDELRKCINNLISHYGKDAVNIIGDNIYYK